jgi:hypothetical protein
MEEKKKSVRKSILLYLPAFTKALRAQLKEDQKRWGDTWTHRPRKGQEGRCFARFRDYQAQYMHAGVPVPWLKIAGECVIAWVRETQKGWDQDQEE